MARTNFHSPKPVRAIEVLLFFEFGPDVQKISSKDFSIISPCMLGNFSSFFFKHFQKFLLGTLSECENSLDTAGYQQDEKSPQ